MDRELRRKLRGDAWNGGLAQLGEHLLCKQGVVGSIPSSSTNDADRQEKEEEEQQQAIVETSSE